MLESTVSLEHALSFPLSPCPENLPDPAQKPMDECRGVRVSLRGDL